MANVGNLFVNISGNTKGLTKALGNAKSKLASFDKEIGRPKGDFLRRARGRFKSAMNERKDQNLRELMGAGGTEGHRQKMRARIGKKEKEARQGYRQAQRENVIGGMKSKAKMTTKMTMGIALGAIGLTISAATIIGRKALSQVNAAKQGVEKFRFLGPSADRIIAAEIAMKLNSIQTAMRPEVSEALAEKAEAKLSAQQQANVVGGTVMSVQLDTYMERLGEVFINALAGFFNNPAAGLNAFITNNPTLNTAIAVSQSTGPVGTTGNTGGP
tara:strand:+ start:210 stop:1025 length:816 start_codon:yes stop_codon:yes gene_type:complete